MSTPYGYRGRVLRVDLSSGRIATEEPDAHFYRTYLGGWGLIGYYLLRELPAGSDPLGPDNLLIFATGALTGAPIAGSGRSAVGAKSPLTGGFGAGEAGGWWGAELARAGWDAIVIGGRAARPVYLWVHDGEAEIRPAEHLWGLLTAPAEDALRAELGDRQVRVAQIGPAGEKLARIAAVMHDINRAAGRGGLGAVMGSKLLKAVAVRGTGRVAVADPEALGRLARGYAAHYADTWGSILQDQGTANGLAGQQRRGGLPSRNFRRGTFAGWEALAGERLRDTLLKARAGCYACPVRCKRVVELRAGPYRVDPAYGGPEYETIGAFGSLCGVDDLAAVAKANELCNAYGLDTISCGVTIAWAMECGERGLLAAADTGGLALRFGDAAGLLRAVELIGRREGWGQVLGEGAYRAALEARPGAAALAMHVKGLEVPLHEPRIKHGLGLGYAVSPTGADHNHNLHDVDYADDDGIAALRPFGLLDPLDPTDLGPAKVRLAAVQIPWATVVNALGYCAFVSLMMDRPWLVEVVRAATGWDTSLHELLKGGERVYTLARAFNAREGFLAADDRLPDRFFEPLGEGPAAANALSRDEFAQARTLFYQMMGWDEQTAAPRAWKLHELGVGWVAEELQRCGRA